MEVDSDILTSPVPICSAHDLDLAVLELAEHEARAASLRKAIADHEVEQGVEEAARRLAGFSLDSPLSSPCDCSFEDLGRGAQEAGAELAQLLRMEEGDLMIGGSGSGSGGSNGESFDPMAWVLDDTSCNIDKRHSTITDHIALFVSLCESFCLVPGRKEWTNVRSGRPEDLLAMYRGILQPFIKKQQPAENSSMELSWDQEEMEVEDSVPMEY